MDIVQLSLVSFVVMGISNGLSVNAVNDFNIRNKRQTYSGRSLSNYGNNINQASTNMGNAGYRSSGTNTRYSNQANTNSRYGNQASTGTSNTYPSTSNNYPRQYSGNQAQSGYSGTGTSTSSSSSGWNTNNQSGSTNSGSNFGSGSSASNMGNYVLNSGTFLPGDTEYAYGVAGRTYGTGYIAEALGYGYQQGVDSNGQNVGYTAIGYLGVMSGK